MRSAPLRVIFGMFFLAASALAATTDGPTDSVGALSYGGVSRTYRLHLPRNTVGAPLVIALHSGASNGQAMEAMTGFDQVADQRGYAVVYPDGVDGRWNDGRAVAAFPAQSQNVDDVGFLAQLITTLHQNNGTSSAKVYLAGYSDGALMAARMICERAELFSAAALVAGTTAENIGAVCSPRLPVSLMLMEGAADTTVPFNGGTVFENGQAEGLVSSVPSMLQYWVQRDGCPSMAAISWLPHLNAGDLTRAQDEYRSCAYGFETVLFTMYGAGHTWPGVAGQPAQLGLTNFDFDATSTIGLFFSRH